MPIICKFKQEVAQANSQGLTQEHIKNIRPYWAGRMNSLLIWLKKLKHHTGDPATKELIETVILNFDDLLFNKCLAYNKPYLIAYFNNLEALYNITLEDYTKTSTTSV